MKLYRHYIWDFDGTLFDSYPHSAAALCAAAARFGIPADPEAVARQMRVSLADAVRALGLTDAQLALFRAYHGDPDFPPPIVPFPEAGPVLRALSRLGARHWLYTHSRRKMSVAYLERFGLAGLFDGFMTPDDPGFARKPSPDALLYLLREHGLPARETAMVGDRELDMRCAEAAGIDGLLLDPDRLVAETCATERIDRLSQLLPASPNHKNM
ncbi:MAG: HAD-IA family hydrolase [Clostridia bacterium]|nr:HAD-IA family hydrolase [Clostridia bacterium]